MKRYTKEELRKIIKDHKHWIKQDCENWQYMKADLSNTDLRGAALSHANLHCANLSGANLSNVSLCHTDLSGANLSHANLHHTYLHHANLSNASLYRADLTNANLISTNLINANLCNANMHMTDFYWADLQCANMYRANLQGAHFDGAKNIPFIPFACPDTGSFIGYKKAGNFIVELKILSDARRCSATGRKCRCDKAEVLSIQYIDKNIPCDYKEIASDVDRNFIYRVGEIVEEPNFDENRWNECAKGIHFFINRQEAVEF